MIICILIAIDCRPLTRGKGGIQRYLENILKYMGDTQNIDLILYSDKPLPEHQLKNLGAVRLRTLSRHPTSRFFWHFFSCIWAFRDKPDVFWSPRHHLPMILPGRTKKIVTIHDIVWKTYPKTLPRIRMLTPIAINSADHLICVSNTTKNQLSALRKITAV